MTRLTLLTKTDCTLCDVAKEVLGRLQQEYELEIETVDVATEHGQRMALEAGMLFPPGLLLDGRPFSYGRLPERKLRRELERSRLAS